jgi:hypothetical protein
VAAIETEHLRRHAAGRLEPVGGSDLRIEPAEVYGLPDPNGTPTHPAMPQPAGGSGRHGRTGGDSRGACR